MTSIISPHPPVTITIQMDKRTGAVNMITSENLPLLTVLSMFLELASKMIRDQVRQTVGNDGAKPT